MPGDPGVADQDVLVELAPEQLVDPGRGALLAAAELAAVGNQRGVQALPGREYAGGQVGRQLAGAGKRREVAPFMVVGQVLVGEVAQAFLRYLFACRPEAAQAIGRPREGGHGIRQRVAGQRVRWLGLRTRADTRQGLVQPFVADLAELAEHLEIAASSGQHRAGGEEQLVEVAVEGHALFTQALADGLVAAFLVHPVFLVDVYRADSQLPTEPADDFRGLPPVAAVAHQQRDVQRGELALQLAQVAQPEVDLAGRIVVFPPLRRAEQVESHARAPIGGGEERAVIGGSQVAAKPDQVHRKSVHGFNRPRSPSRRRASRGVLASSRPVSAKVSKASRWISTAGPTSTTGQLTPASRRGRCSGLRR
ncbi:Uncharacterised protein [Klebsiella pneumoniae]|nr:Uncharacterised protein [Klebsiella pneumoniae]